MPQTHQQRRAANPGYARWKNRKRTLRAAVAAGRLTDAERRRIQDAERDQVLNGAVPQRRDDAAAAAMWRAAHDGDDVCVDECITARHDACRCWCKGRNHGRGIGRAAKLRWRTCVCWICGDAYTPRAGNQRYCSVGCRREASRRRMAGVPVGPPDSSDD